MFSPESPFGDIKIITTPLSDILPGRNEVYTKMRVQSTPDHRKTFL